MAGGEYSKGTGVFPK